MSFRELQNKNSSLLKFLFFKICEIFHTGCRVLIINWPNIRQYDLLCRQILPNLWYFCSILAIFLLEKLSQLEKWVAP